VTADPTAVFVYGTLQRGYVREHCWPRSPLKIEPAAVHGELYDLGPYPALVAGKDTIAGELWHFAPEDMEPTLAALDKVEGCDDSSGDWYIRSVINCQTANGPLKAWTYRFGPPEKLARAPRVAPDPTGVCRWSQSSS
jgi:gamma-glutamylcyclotransferase (GGCT)/AIG2-like uncharacterized protein YtfP